MTKKKFLVNIFNRITRKLSYNIKISSIGYTHMKITLISLNTHTRYVICLISWINKYIYIYIYRYTNINYTYNTHIYCEKQNNKNINY